MRFAAGKPFPRGCRRRSVFPVGAEIVGRRLDRGIADSGVGELHVPDARGRATDDAAIAGGAVVEGEIPDLRGRGVVRRVPYPAVGERVVTDIGGGRVVGFVADPA